MPTTPVIRALIVFGIVFLALARPVGATVITASYSSATDVPVTAAGYTVTGNSVNLSLNYAPVTGTTLTVIKNTGLDFIHGTFSNLAQGQRVVLLFGGVSYSFVANYFGGTGNDLVLQWADTRIMTSGAVTGLVPATGVLVGKIVTTVAAGPYHSLALCSDGTLAAWGYNYAGQLGNATTTGSLVPVTVDITGVLAGKTVTAIAAGGSFSLALCSDGTLAAWGYSGQGELGNNSTTHSLVPVAVTTFGALAGKTVTAIAAGGSFSLALCSDGTLAAWGANNAGQLGNNSTADSYMPVAVTTFGALAGKTVTAIAAGGSFSLALCSDGTMVTWGDNSYDELGNNSMTNRQVPAVVAKTGVLVGKTVTTIATGSAHCLVLCSDGTLAAWGYNASGQLGNNSATDSSIPVAVDTTGVLASKTIIAVAAGNRHSLALCSDGTLAAWGYNYSGQLGNNSTTNSYMPVAVTTGGALAGKTVIAVSTSSDDCLAVCSDGTLVSWGYNNFGELGNNGTTQSNVPVTVTTTGGLTGKIVIAIAAAYLHGLALCSDGTVAAWGDNTYGDLGYRSPYDSVLPVAVNTSGALAGKTVIAVAAGYDHNLALCSDGTLAAWGDDGNGQLGNNSPGLSYVPVAVTTTGVLGGKSVVSVAAGYAYSLALCSDSTLAAWGYNGNGQLGDNSTTTSAVPVAVDTTGVLAGKTVIAIAAGQYHSLVLCSDGTLAAWGDNTYHQLGNNSAAYSPVPVVVEATGVLVGKTVTAIAAGSTHNLALCSDGTLAAWGDNTHHQLGNNSTAGSSVPVAVDATGVLAGKIITTIAAGDGYSLALCSDGTETAWGDNGYGQLGNNSTVESNVPVAVGITGELADKIVIAIAAGNQASLSLVATAYPKMGVTGNNIAVPSTDTTPTIADGTDFGTAALLGTQVTHTFTIANSGPAPLNPTGSSLVTLSGPAATDFKVTAQPSSSIAAGSSTTFAITFDPSQPGQRTATVTIASNDLATPRFTFSITGFATLPKKLAQTITFNTPATLYFSQSPFTLTASSTSGLPVTLNLVEPIPTGTMFDNNVLTITTAGTVKVQAAAPASGNYAAATTVLRTITVKADPTALTLINLNQTYDGQFKPVDTLGGMNTPDITYKVGADYVPDAPINAGSYPVKALDGTVTVTGTLVIAKRTLYVTPDDNRKFAGQANPPLTVSYSGFADGESGEVVTKAPLLTTTATTASIGGTYPITASGATALNYNLVYGKGTMVVESFAGNYEALLVDANQVAVGKLTISVAATSKTFTAKLATATETAALSFTGALTTNTVTEQASGMATTLAGTAKTPYVITFTLPAYGNVIASATRGGTLLGSASDGQKLSTQTVLFAGVHTAVMEPATPAGTTVPPGAGWATVSASTLGVLTVAGKLGDGAAFSATLNPDGLSDPGYRLFVQPYVAARTQSFLAGGFALATHPTLTNRRYLAQQVMTWTKTGLAADASYRAGFAPVTTVLMIDPWLPPAAARAAAKTTPLVPAISLAQRLGLTGTSISFGVNEFATGSAQNSNLPSRLGLSAANVVSVLTPLANATKWKTLTFLPTTGTFTGSFELSDTVSGKTVVRPVSFSGVLRQPATTQDSIIGDGHYLLPSLSGTERSTGEVMFTRP